MTADHVAGHADNRDIYVRDVILALRRRWMLILATVMVVGAMGLAYAIFAKPLYTASAVIQPMASEEAGGALSSLASQFGGAASLAGISLDGGDAEAQANMAILRSREFSMRFIAQNDLMPYLFHEQWNPETQDWRSGEPGLLARMIGGLSHLIARLSGDEGWRPPSSIPSDWEAFDLFDTKVRHLREDTETGLITVSFEVRNPELAAKWTNAFVAQANAEIRARTVSESSRAISFLREEIQKTAVAGVQDTIYGLMQSQLEKVMFANSRPDYAFKVIDKAVPPEDRSHPKRPLVVLLSIFFGLALGGCLALGVEAYRGTLARV
ncbi:LPS biosynthesis protein [Iodidimonas muriae]|uniref:LPS biosynthesis protein n=1 Tax=Iodidimonas muriae TaxID=261467 RepID=A0ABQ2LBC2_9PROT|nr:Wzz/FepE/Etk N-terminal domain-containing protein [Iodidimonas muriae]GER07975.1 LPS biosynthesis protein [Kordiimonadales bacterium JCM 17843]GGO09325.1 LPS biosynthesis protein [Iodidimonas muriae]